MSLVYILWISLAKRKQTRKGNCSLLFLWWYCFYRFSLDSSYLMFRLKIMSIKSNLKVLKCCQIKWGLVGFGFGLLPNHFIHWNWKFCRKFGVLFHSRRYTNRAKTPWAVSKLNTFCLPHFIFISSALVIWLEISNIYYFINIYWQLNSIYLQSTLYTLSMLLYASCNHW